MNTSRSINAEFTARMVALSQSLLKPLRWVLLRGAIVLAEKIEIQGLEVVNLGRAADAHLLFSRMQAVLDFVAAADTRRLDRMRRDFRQILIMPKVRSVGTYWDVVNACGLSARHVMLDSIADIALTLVHEATHASLQQRGVRYTPQLRARIEKVCLHAELDFANRAAVEPELLTEIEDALAGEEANRQPRIR